jgi:hypothetical protein
LALHALNGRYGRGGIGRLDVRHRVFAIGPKDDMISNNDTLLKIVVTSV